MKIDTQDLINRARQQTYNEFLEELEKTIDKIKAKKEVIEKEATNKMFKEMDIKEMTISQLVDKLNQLENKGFDIHIEGKGNGNIKFGSN